jgi:hypothetical protein
MPFFQETPHFLRPVIPDSLIILDTVNGSHEALIAHTVAGIATISPKKVLLH